MPVKTPISRRMTHQARIRQNDASPNPWYSPNHNESEQMIFPRSNDASGNPWYFPTIMNQTKWYSHLKNPTKWCLSVINDIFHQNEPDQPAIFYNHNESKRNHIFPTQSLKISKVAAWITSPFSKTMPKNSATKNPRAENRSTEMFLTKLLLIGKTTHHTNPHPNSI